jgi:Domain of unknown function (DUF4258)
MKTTIHAERKMNQRGINRLMVDLCLEYGKIDQSKRVLGREDAKELLELMQSQMTVLKKIIDKGGIVVIAENNTFITTYNR